MEREKMFKTAGRSNLKKLLLAVGLYGVPIALAGIAAYLIYSGRLGRDRAEKNKRKLNDIKSRDVSKRVKKGIPPGLINLGNTCFINCLLQGLASLTNFCQWMYTLDKDEDKILQDSLKDILQVLTNRKETERDIFTASDIVDCLCAHGWIIRSEQQDTHEFFQVLMSTLDEEMGTSNVDKHQFEFQSNTPEKISIIGKVCQYFPAKSLEMQSPFKGMLANRMICNRCGNKSVRFEAFESVSVRIPRLSALTGATLERCLADFVRSEQVDGVECPRCTSLSNAGIVIKSSFQKQLSFATVFSLVFAKLPKCLCIHIQRSYLLANGTSYKNCQFVRFTDILDLHPYRYGTVSYNDVSVDSAAAMLACHTSMPLRGGNIGNFQVHARQASRTLESSRSLYRLKAVIVHIGDVLDGHFVTYRRAIGTEDQWVYASDEHIRTASKQSVLSNTAYLLFYERTNDITG